MRTFLLSFALTATLCSISVPQVHGTRKLIVVISDQWTSATGTLYLFDKTPNGWKQKKESWHVSLGDSGLAWGIGILKHPRGGRIKVEGDLCSPAGIFHIGKLYGLDENKPEGIRYPYHKITSQTVCVDDAQSTSYNRIVESNLVKIDWTSSEEMAKVVPDYKYVLVVKHNPDHEKGKGSCIFLHINNKPTTGCTSMDEENMLILLRWLNPKKKTLIVQLPETEYQQLRPRWKLPSLIPH
ncbi:MAG: hypothetical protein PHP42_06840 [Bacteroidota bacterium]|nr:hypothetical protein [Bacteroidota bacterium]